MVEQAFGFPGNVPFVNVLVYVSPGSDIHQQQNTQDGFGGEEKALVQKRDFNSYQRAPKWIDPPIVSSKIIYCIWLLFCRKFNIGLVTFRDGEPNTPVTQFMKDLLKSSLGTGILLLK